MSLVLFLLGCGSHEAPTVVVQDDPAPAATTPPTLTVHLRGEEVVLETNARGVVGIAETGAHEAGWFGEDCLGADKLCHPLLDGGGSTTLKQVHHLDEVNAGSTLFDNHFGGSLAYMLRSGDQCWSSAPAHFSSCEPTLVVDEKVEELLAGHVEPTHWKDPAIPRTAATPAHHNPPLATSSPTPAHVQQIKTFREAHKPAAKHCCKRCSSGQACGNSCISWSKTCHTVGGCAC